MNTTYICRVSSILLVSRNGDSAYVCHGRLSSTIGARLIGFPDGYRECGQIPEEPCVSLKLAAVIAHNPDVVFIEFATNDAFLPYQISLEDSNQNLNAMIDALRAANPATEIMLQTMNSCLDEPGGGRHASVRPQVGAYFDGYREVAAARGLRLVDHYPNWLKLMTDDRARFDQLVPDRIHPQAPGINRSCCRN